jgi:hypothetical protein
MKKRKPKPKPRRKPMPKPSRPFKDKRPKWSTLSDGLWKMLKERGLDEQV